MWGETERSQAAKTGAARADMRAPKQVVNVRPTH